MEGLSTIDASRAPPNGPRPWRSRAPTGEYQWVQWQGRPWRDESGNIGGIVIATEDVTAHRQAEASADHLAAIVASSHEAIVSTDLNSIVTTWNGGATSLLGYNADEIVGKPIGLMIPPERIAEEAERVQAAAPGRRRWAS